MKRSSIILFTLGLLRLHVSSHTIKGDKFIINADTISQNDYDPIFITDPAFKKIYLPFDYGDFKLKDLSKLEVLKNAVIKSVDLVYTRFPLNEEFDELNMDRLDYLYAYCPNIFASAITSWRIIAQTKCKSESSARKMFHGFAIVYKPAPTKVSAAADFKGMKEVWTGEAAPVDSSVYKIFARNKWKNMTVVTDLTGSMAPYFAQVLLWYKLTFSTKNFKEFIFFNDGDKKEDKDKKTGSTGGIYYCKSTYKDSVFKTAGCCISNGFGGDIPENNVEAILYAIERNPRVKEVILIADNWAPMRDYRLMSRVHVPVHVVLCGCSPDAPINTEYLDLARKTKGSVHTMEGDLHNLVDVAEGKTIEFLGREYTITGGKFVPVVRM